MVDLSESQGPYLLRRWKLVVLASIPGAITGWAGTKTYSHVTWWSLLDWIAVTATVVLACNVLDHLDALLNTYPSLVTRDPKALVRLQNPMRLEYWVAMAKLAMSLPAETDLDPAPIRDLEVAIRVLGPASRSWKTMAALFPVNLRQDLCILYAFFRTADDLVDDAPTLEERRRNLATIRRFLHDVFLESSHEKKANDHSPLFLGQVDWISYARLLPSKDVLTIFRSFARISHYLCPRALSELTDAWELDIKGQPIQSQEDLLNYAGLISGTFGELCTCVIMYKTGRGNWGSSRSGDRKNDVLEKARATGQCLQLINIARDVIKDSMDGRCYVPLQYMTRPVQHYRALKSARAPLTVGERIIKSYALRILELADTITLQAQRGIDGLPPEVQDSIRAAFEIYMAISPALRNADGFPHRAKVPKSQQQWIALRCIYGFHSSTARAMYSTCDRIFSKYLSKSSRFKGSKII
ncbi:hypothetical protein EC973_009151 [Apophysomyces ossiformis]|uniref:15-cis-phytoene synthase n=1 Tax=Apophysomyces ossiformis TaxID=679940 RepID=A0A8H7BRU8_9FUNG|nr:hypothetical protein EC973_009151 [Apophysomyces ossiformis]